MKKVITILSLLLLSTLTAQYQNYYSRNVYSLTSAGAMKYGFYGYDNPAVLNTFQGFDIQASWFSDKYDHTSAWAVNTSLNNIGFTFVNNKFGSLSAKEYKFAFGFGSDALSLGLSYAWTSGDAQFYRLSNSLAAGLLYRPFKYLSLGVTGAFPTKYNSEAVFDVAIRPFGNELLSLFADYVETKNTYYKNRYSAGISLEAYPGVRLVGRYFENKTFNVGVNLSLGNIGISSQALFNEDNKSEAQTYSIRLGSYDRNPVTKVLRASAYLQLNLIGNMAYTRYKFLDGSNTLLETLDAIKTAKNDPSISGITINTSGMSINREMLWEIRSALKDFKESGKKVYIYIDRVSLDYYHFVSIADKIFLDPLGYIILEGYASSRSYYADMLDKIGVGFTELRYFKYKSALETFSRTSMSEGEKEQRQDFINDLYMVAKDDICKSRNISSADFEKYVNDYLIISSDDALTNNLVDKVGRWDDMIKTINEQENKEIVFMSPAMLEKNILPDDNYWGAKPVIALIYALGNCAMDEGINARKLVEDVKYAVENKNVKAIVLRVDSPGGDALASDLIAEQLKKAKGIKPIIVSQGFVAGSGGYWLSMYADTIIAAPQTITGSIGVISGWYYNKSLKEKLGVSTDKVSIGEHSDLMTGLALPLINAVVLPDRDYNDKEKILVEKNIRSMYKEFVTKVAQGRNKTYEEIDKLGEGHFYSGITGYKNGLVDLIGNLRDAISLAVKKAGLKSGEYNLVELPEPGFIDFNAFLPGMISTPVNLQNNEILNDIKFRLNYNGKVMPLLPLGIN